MMDWFKGLVLGIGVFLGLAEPREAPGLDFRVHRDAVTLYASVELLELPGAGLDDVVRSGFRVRLTLEARAGDRRAVAWRDVRYDGAAYYVTVSESGTTHRSADAGGAWAMASRFLRVPLGPVAGLAYPLDAEARVVLDLPDDADYDPMVLWGYRAASATRSFAGLGSIPYY